MIALRRGRAITVGTSLTFVIPAEIARANRIRARDELAVATVGRFLIVAPVKFERELAELAVRILDGEGS